MTARSMVGRRDQIDLSRSRPPPLADRERDVRGEGLPWERREDALTCGARRRMRHVCRRRRKGDRSWRRPRGRERRCDARVVGDDRSDAGVAARDPAGGRTSVAGGGGSEGKEEAEPSGGGATSTNPRRERGSSA